MGVASLFVLLGDLNQLAILSTMPFLITYAYVNYSYVSLAMSYDLATVQHADEVETVGYGSTNKMNDLNELFPERRDVNITSTEETETGIISQEATWYSMFSNRYVSFLGVSGTYLKVFQVFFSVSGELGNPSLNSFLVCCSSFCRSHRVVLVHWKSLPNLWSGNFNFLVMSHVQNSVFFIRFFAIRCHNNFARGENEFLNQD